MWTKSLSSISLALNSVLCSNYTVKHDMLGSIFEHIGQSDILQDKTDVDGF